LPQHPETPPPDPPRASPARRIARAFRSGSLAIVASALPGFVNYALLIYLTYRFGLAEAGAYRLTVSLFAVLGTPTLQEASKLFIRAFVGGDRDSMRILAFGRVYAGLLGVALVALAVGADRLAGLSLTNPILIAVAPIAAAGFALDLYVARFQAERRFAALLGIALAKAALSLGLFMALMEAGYGAVVATCWQLAALALFNAGFFLRHVAPLVRLQERWPSPIHVARAPQTRQAFQLSAGAFLPGFLEHWDKILVGAVFGLEALGLYALGYTTGRFIYNTLKPALYVLYRRMVDWLPGPKLLFAVFVGFTLFGAVLAAGYIWAVSAIPSLARFQGTEAVASVIFLSYGFAMADTLFYQSHAINKDGDSAMLLKVGVLSSLISLAPFAGVFLLPQALALPVLAGYYPLRHASTMALIWWLTRRPAGPPGGSGP
jgi:hypothetical protein